MAWSKKKNGSVSTSEEIGNILEASSVVRGELKSDRGFRIDGKIEGLVESSAAIIIGESGVVSGYPTVQFVHVDVRSTPYFWTDTSGHTDQSRDDDDQEVLSESAATSEPSAAAPASPGIVQAPTAVRSPPSTVFVPTAPSPASALPLPGKSALDPTALLR
jgi:hypothetical protein